MSNWNVEEFCGYKPITTFWDDFSIADKFGIEGVQDTFERAFDGWKDNYKYLTELVMVLNHKCWEHYEKNDLLSETYQRLFYKAADYAETNLSGDELSYYYKVTD